MHKFLYLSFASALIFGLGVVSGNFSSPRRAPVAASSNDGDAALKEAVGDELEFVAEPSVPTAPTPTVAELESDLLPVPFADDIQTVAVASDDEFAAPFPVENSSESDAATDHEIETILLRHFPGISGPELEGRMEAFAGMPAKELSQLLSETSFLSEPLPLSDLSEFDSAPAELIPIVDERFQQDDSEIAVEFTRVARANLLNLMTVGYRRSVLRSHLAIASPLASAVQTTVQKQFDLSPGQLQHSPNPLHVAIANDEPCMFVMEPGNVLTRNGQFERLQNGRVGFHNGEELLALRGTTELPEDARHVRFSEDGTLHFESSDGKPDTAGQVSLVSVDSAGDLKSLNGVYFSLPSSIPDAPSPDPRLHLQTVELSNVNVEQEQRLVEHFDRLKSRSNVFYR